MAETWTKPSGPILTATQSWEQNAVCQAWVVYEGNGFFRMMYTGGWSSPSIGYAECHGDPTIAANWVKPNSSAFWPGLDFNAFVKRNGLYYLFFTYLGNIWSAWSPDPRAPQSQWFNARAILTPGAQGSIEAGICGPSPVWDGDELDLFYVSGDQNPTTTYQQRLARLSKGDFAQGGLFKDPRNPLASLRLGTGCYGITGNIQKVGSNWNAWQHQSLSGILPTDIYHWYSPDKINWTVLNGGQPVISRAMLWNPSAFDQVGDCVVVEAADIGMSYAFYDADNNPAETACIAVSSIAGTLSTICP